MSRGEVLVLEEIISTEHLAEEIAWYWHSWDNARQKWKDLVIEIKEYLSAIDTKSTTNSSLPFANTTTIPKLSQIRDNLITNYIAAILPNEKAFVFEGDDAEAQQIIKRQKIEAYTRNKFFNGGSHRVLEQSLYDYVEAGNAFIQTEWVHEKYTDPDTGEEITKYIGPRFVRIDPFDIVFNPLATSFENSPKIVRSHITKADLAKMLRTRPDLGFEEEKVEKIFKDRANIRNAGQGQTFRANESQALQSFGDSITHYFRGDTIELLHFYGDFYDDQTQTLYENVELTVADRTTIIRNRPNPSWNGRAPIQHVGWRPRPDNLWAEGPLNQLVGMQFMIDKWENKKADVLDELADPVMVFQGQHSSFVRGVDKEIHLEEPDSRVSYLVPDTSVLNVNIEMRDKMQLMERMAGAPEQALGFRTPGEKTKFEVQVLENAANRVFINKATNFEMSLLEPALRDFVAIAARRLPIEDTIRVVGEDGVVEFLGITKNDLAATGRIVPKGARHFAAMANLLQDLSNIGNSSFGADPLVRAHFSGKEIARLVSDTLQVHGYNIFNPYVSIAEQQELAALQQEAQAALQQNQFIDPEFSDEELGDVPPEEGVPVDAAQG